MRVATFKVDSELWEDFKHTIRKAKALGKMQKHESRSSLIARFIEDWVTVAKKKLEDEIPLKESEQDIDLENAFME